MFGSLFSGTPARFGTIFQDIRSKLGNIYQRAQEIPAVKAKLEEYKVPQFLQTAKQVGEAGKGVVSGLRQLYGLGQSIPLGR